MAIRINVRLSGKMGATATEVWSVGLNYGGGAAPLDQAQALAAAGDIRDALAASSGAVLGTLKNGVGAQVNLDQVDVYSYGVTGPAVSHGAVPFSPAIAFTGAPTAPPQTTGCITLQTALPGRSYRGRIYWPQTAPAIDTNFKSSTAKGLGGGFATMNGAIEAELLAYGPWVLGVYSAVQDVVTPVTTVRAGDVLDTQRRRRDALAETFTITAV